MTKSRNEVTLSVICLLCPVVISKTFYIILFQMNMAKRLQPCFSALGPETEEKINWQKNKIRFDLQP